MREIKFRAWNKKEKIMWSWDLMNRNKIFALDDKLPDRDSWIAIPNHKDIILTQFTGLKDKNGKEIYKDDILKLSHEYDQTDNFHLHDFIDDTCYLRCIDTEYIEIIGNKFENPELLENEK